ncbi:ISKra4 family transposase [Streptomyces sp. NPDC000618]|uniref:ISKra4 family transposase n=1 Tax=Streptomyces sp. NPDC000618 TaxID=3154265 RepID=UPI0033298E4F
MEESVEEGARELGRPLLQGHFDLCADREEARLSALDAGARAALAGCRTRLEKGHRRQLASAVGTVTVSRCTLCSPGLPNLDPADDALALPRERHSLGLRRLAMLETARGSYDSALEAIDRRRGHRAVGKHQVEHLVRAAAADVCAIYARRTPVPAGEKTLLVLSVDGKGIVMRPDDLREATRKAAERAWRTFRTRLSAGEKTCRKRMAPWRSSTTPTRPRAVRLTSSPPPGSRPTRRPRRPAHPAQGPQGPAEVAHRLGPNDADQVIAAAFDQAEARDPQHHRCWVVLVDGTAHQLELIQAEAARRNNTIHIVLDIVHVLEKSWAVARCFQPATDLAAEDWVGTKAARILAGDAPSAVAALRTEADRAGLSPEQRAAVDKACRCLESNAIFVHCDQAVDSGWPIAAASSKERPAT